MDEFLNVASIDNIIRDIYISCDPKRSESVPIKLLINFITPYLRDNKDELEILREKLESFNSNQKISSSDFYKVMMDWTLLVKQNNLQIEKNIESIIQANEIISFGETENSPNTDLGSQLIDEYETENLKLKNDISLLEDKITSLDFRNKTLVEELEEIRDHFSLSEDQNDHLANELRNVTKLLQFERNRNEQLNTAIKSSEEKLTSQTENNIILHKRIDDLERRQSEHLIKIDEYKIYKTKSESKISDLTKREQQFQAQIKEFKSIVYAKDIEIEALNQITNELQSENKNKSELVAFYTKEIELIKEKLTETIPQNNLADDEELNNATKKKIEITLKNSQLQLPDEEDLIQRQCMSNSKTLFEELTEISNVNKILEVGKKDIETCKEKVVSLCEKLDNHFLPIKIDTKPENNNSTLFDEILELEFLINNFVFDETKTHCMKGSSHSSIHQNDKYLNKRVEDLQENLKMIEEKNKIMLDDLKSNYEKEFDKRVSLEEELIKTNENNQVYIAQLIETINSNSVVQHELNEKNDTFMKQIKYLNLDLELSQLTIKNLTFENDQLKNKQQKLESKSRESFQKKEHLKKLVVNWKSKYVEIEKENAFNIEETRRVNTVLNDIKLTVRYQNSQLSKTLQTLQHKFGDKFETSDAQELLEQIECRKHERKELWELFNLTDRISLVCILLNSIVDEFSELEQVSLLEYPKEFRKQPKLAENKSDIRCSFRDLLFRVPGLSDEWEANDELDLMLTNFGEAQENFKNLTVDEMEKKFCTLVLSLTFNLNTSKKRHQKQQDIYSSNIIKYCEYLDTLINLILQLLNSNNIGEHLEIIISHLQQLKELAMEIGKCGQNYGVSRYEMRILDVWSFVVNYVAVLTKNTKSLK